MVTSTKEQKKETRNSTMQEINHKKSRIKRNISIFLKANGISDYEFYKNSGITRGILSQNNGISEENLSRFLAYAPEVNVDWLLSGEGEMLKSSTANEQSSVSTGDDSPVNLHGTMEVRQTTMSDTSRELELLRAQLDEKERTIQIQQQLISELQKRK